MNGSDIIAELHRAALNTSDDTIKVTLNLIDLYQLKIHELVATIRNHEEYIKELQYEIIAKESQ